MKRILTNWRLPVILLCLFLFTKADLFAQTATLAVQGVLKKADGTTVPDGNNYTFTFKLWDGQTGGTAVWEETKTNVSILGGVYDVVLGDGATVLSAPFDKPYYLGVSIGTGSGPEFSPRPRLSSAPYALSLLGNNNVFPSNGSVGVGTTNPHSSAMLEVSSTNKGMLPPRMTKDERNDITSPATGLLLFQTDNTSGFYYYTGSEWKSVKEFSGATTLKIGDTYQGGIIFYLEPSGVNGLIAAPASAYTYTNPWCSNGAIPDAQGTAIGSGQANTISIILKSTCYPYVGAAEVANDIIIDGYGDWFLPSRDELQLMHQNLHVAGLGGFVNNANYWSSSESDGSNAWYQKFTGNANTAPAIGSRNSNYQVRMIRAF